LLSVPLLKEDSFTSKIVKGRSSVRKVRDELIVKISKAEEAAHPPN